MAIGANQQGAQNLLKQDYKDDITLEEGVKLIIKVRQTLCLPLSTRNSHVG
jgi:20S proteasome alpha/beta subunit